MQLAETEQTTLKTFERWWELTIVPLRAEIGGVEVEAHCVSRSEAGAIADPATLELDIGGRGVSLVLGYDALEALCLDLPDAGSELRHSAEAGALLIEFLARSLLQKLEQSFGAPVRPAALRAGQHTRSQRLLAANLRLADGRTFPMLLEGEAIADHLSRELQQRDPEVARWAQAVPAGGQVAGSFVGGMFDVLQADLAGLRPGDSILIDASPAAGLDGALIMDDGSNWPARFTGREIVRSGDGTGAVAVSPSGIPDLGALAPAPAPDRVRAGLALARCAMTARQLRMMVAGSPLPLTSTGAADLICAGHVRARGQLEPENDRLLFRVLQVAALT